MTSITHDTDPASPEVAVALTSGSFTEYPLSPVLLDALAERGLRAPTPIQAAAIPALLNGRDVVGQARTGSGKTLAFALPLLDAVDAGRATVQALVLAPTRELASQVAAVIADFGATKGVTVALLYGGTSSGPQRSALRRGAQVAVGTPGRILDLIGQGALWLDQARFVVLDEADEMFDQGFAQDVERIMDKTSNSRQTALFSATMPDWVQQTAARYLYDPETIAVDTGAAPVNPVPHTAYVVPTGDPFRPAARSRFGARDDADRQAKFGALRDLLDHRGQGKTIVFGRTRQGVAALAKQLDRAGYPVGALQGNMTQTERDFVMDAFRSGRVDILVATNVAARGLDLADVDLVVNVELPESAEMLTHRVGRTGRMGRAGLAITLLAGADLVRWQLLTRDASIPIRQLPWPGAEAALSVADGETAQRDVGANRAEQNGSAAPADLTMADAANTNAPYAVEEGMSMDESPAPERSRRNQGVEPAPSTTARAIPQVRRSGRRAADDTGVERTRPAGDAADLIARALANVNTTSPAPATPRTAPPPQPAAPAPAPARRDARPERAAAPPRETEALRQMQPPAIERSLGPDDWSAPSRPLRGTPRPPWLQDPAARAAHWRAASLPAPVDSPPQPVTTVSEPPAVRPPEPEPEPIGRRVAEQPALSRPAASPPPVRRREPATPSVRLAEQGADTRSAALAAPEATPVPAQPNVPTDQPMFGGRSASTRPIPTVRASRSRPAVPPATDDLTPVAKDVERRAPASLATDVGTTRAGSPVAGIEPETGQGMAADVPVTGTAPPAEPEATSLAQPDDQPTPMSARPPVRRRTGAQAQAAPEPESPATEPAAAADARVAPTGEPTATSSKPEGDRSAALPETTDSSSEATAAVPPTLPTPAEASNAVEETQPGTATEATSVPADDAEAAEAAARPSRRGSSRRSRAAADAPVAAPEAAMASGTPEEVTPETAQASETSAAASPPAEPVSSEPAGDEATSAPAEAASTGRPRGRSRSGRSATATAEPTSEAAASPDRDPESDGAGEPMPKGRSSRSRSRAATTESATTGMDEEAKPKPRRQRSPRPAPEPATPAAGPADQPPPGNRRSTTDRSSGKGPKANRRSGGTGGESRRNRPAEAGNARTPERGNSVQPQTARRASSGQAAGTAPRRRPSAAPSTRCAACGTALPKGSTRKYCPACERELAVRSQES